MDSFYDDIFCLSDKDFNGVLHLNSINVSLDFNRIVKGEIKPTGTMVFKRVKGKKYADLLFTGWPGLFLISDKVVDILRKNSIIGWEVFPAKIEFSELAAVEYFGLMITGKCGKIDSSKSKILMVSNPNRNFHVSMKKMGIYFDIGTWDRSEIFSPSGTNYICLTNRVKKILENAMLTNIDFRKITEMEVYSV